MRRPLSHGALVILLSLIPAAASAPGSGATATSLAPVELVADGFHGPAGVAVDQAGAIFVSERKAGRITRLTPDGRRTVLLAGLDRPLGLAVDLRGRLLIVEEGTGRLWRLEPTGARTLLASDMKDPRWIASGQRSSPASAWTRGATRATVRSSSHGGRAIRS